MGDDDLVQDRFECGQDAVGILIAHDGDDADEESEIELLPQRLSQRDGSRGIVCGIDENRWSTAHSLQSARRGHCSEAGAHGVDIKLTLRPGPEERLDRREGDDGVVRLMLAVQRKEHVAVHTAEPLKFEQLPTDSHLSAQHRELRAFASDRGVGAHRLRQQYVHRFRRLIGDHRDRAHICVRWHEILGLPGDDSGLFAGDLGDGVAQVVGMVDADGRDDRDRGVDHVGGVPSPAEPDLHDRHVDRGVGERGESHCGDDLELAQTRARLPEGARLRLLVDKFDEGLDFTVGSHVSPRTDRHAVNGNSFHRRLQVRTGGAPGAPGQRDQQRVHHPGHRCLAICSTDMNRWITELR